MVSIESAQNVKEQVKGVIRYMINRIDMPLNESELEKYYETLKSQKTFRQYLLEEEQESAE
jgi:hypothetical protein